MDDNDLVIHRFIGTHSMFYAGCSACMTPEWVDDPTAAIVFQDHDLAARTLRGILAVDMTDFPITLKPVKYTDAKEEES